MDVADRAQIVLYVGLVSSALSTPRTSHCAVLCCADVPREEERL